MTLDEYRERARLYLEEATGFGEGVRVDDPAYVAVTEGRDQGPGYSSCGDLAHGMLFGALGVDAPWINRKAAHGWTVGMNVNRLLRQSLGGSNPIARCMREGETLALGDVVVMYDPADARGLSAHVAVVRSHTPDALASFDYGQGSMRPEGWKLNPRQIEGCERTRRIVGSAKAPSGVSRALRLVPVLDAGGKRKAIMSVLTLEDLHAKGLLP